MNPNKTVKISPTLNNNYEVSYCDQNPNSLFKLNISNCLNASPQNIVKNTENLSYTPTDNLFNFSPENSQKSKQKQICSEEGEINTGRWTRDEHESFVKAICLYGNEWKKVQKHIPTRSSTQARSHAQKFFLRMQNKLDILEGNELNLAEQLKGLSGDILTNKIKNSANICFEITEKERDRLIEVLVNFSKLVRNKKNFGLDLYKENMNKTQVLSNFHESKDLINDKNLNDRTSLVKSIQNKKCYFKIEKDQRFLQKKTKINDEINFLNIGKLQEYTNHKEINSEFIKDEMMTDDSINQNKNPLNDELIILKETKGINQIVSEKGKEAKAYINKKLTKTKRKIKKIKQENGKLSTNEMTSNNLNEKNMKFQEEQGEFHEYAYLNHYLYPNNTLFPLNSNILVQLAIKDYCRKEDDTIVNPFVINFPIEDNLTDKEEENFSCDEFYPMIN